ncbi:trypsin-like serine protease [Streptomyces sp. SID4985]|uniref:trypsin-like serine protease n=1 Tax=Streptomyces sp. SID4985 TaxID=2690292 RepID=UPI00136DCF7C|nr:trypsin-like serine protease [Streptomyces sp. SID4985]MYQ49419.1 trypsin-like serine protease [Streptomyces sp. SID4985]
MVTPNARPFRLATIAAALVATPFVLTAAPAQAVTGTVPSDATYAATARLDIGDSTRGCSGVLVDTEWLLTAASCFVTDPATSLTVPAGKPALKTTATIGRTDLAGTQGEVRTVVELVPRTDRDVVLARLNRPVTTVAPLALSATAATTGEDLQVAGYGRTADEWAPMKLHTGTFTVGATDATTAAVTGKNGVAICAGDTGGPVVRTEAGGARLVALSSRSYQGGCFGIPGTETRTDGVGTRVDDLGGWISSKAGATRITDFNCDGVEDIAIADPEASVGGDAKAGLVRVVYGGGKGTTEINQDLDWVSGGSEANDGFGSAIDTVDYNEDGCTDLVVGTPGEDLGSATDAGMADVLYGAPGGVGTGAQKATHFEQGAGTGTLLGSVSETGDRLGAAIAAGATASGEPYVAIGDPGEDLGTIVDAGSVIYAHANTNVGISQDSTGVPGAAETGDKFGSVIAADANHIAVGAPNDAIGADTDAGNVMVFDQKLNSEGKPTALFGMDQDLDTVSGGAEAGDLFGKSLALVPYRPSGSATATDSILAVGSPGEDLTLDTANKADAGNVITFQVKANGTFTQLKAIDTGTADDDVSGTIEAGDQFGSSVTAVNTAPRAVGTAATMRLAVGSVGEAIGTEAGAGSVQTFPLLGAPGASDRWIQVGDSAGIPGTPTAGQKLGSSIRFTGTQLYVGMPFGPSATGALYALPMSNVTAGGTAAPVTAYQPGTGGLPAVGTRFGASAR